MMPIVGGVALSERSAQKLKSDLMGGVIHRSALPLCPDSDSTLASPVRTARMVSMETCV